MKSIYLGLDIGSVSIKAALIDEEENLFDGLYLKTSGEPISSLKEILKRIYEKYNNSIRIRGVGTTGSGRKLIGVITGAQVIKNEIICHAFAAIKKKEDVKTIIDIGGQDSKLIIIQDKMITDFAMNNVCAAGTGSFIEQQSHRLNISLENFGEIALRSDKTINIAGRCTVFAESDMINLQQTGEKKENIIYGLCLSLVKNYLNTLGRGKEIVSPIIFQGGVAANKGIIKAFEQILEREIIVPENYKIMGAFGAALILARYQGENEINKFRGFNIINKEYRSEKFICNDCENSCNVVNIIENINSSLSCWGDRCGKWTNSQ